LNIAIGLLTLGLLANDPWQILGGTPAPAPSPEPDLVVIGKLVHMTHPSFGCGYFSLGALAEYSDLRVLKGSYDQSTIYAFHPCPEMPPQPCRGVSAALSTLEAGAYHHLELSRRNFEQINLLDDGGQPHSETMTFFVICASPAPVPLNALALPSLPSVAKESATVAAAPPNPSFKRTRQKRRAA